MLPDKIFPDIGRVARRELSGFFASPAAFLFLGAFLGVTLFVFFWVETFFSRNIADVRPLFDWMPLLLIFLVAALTMRAWAEERRGGTLELLITAPISPTALVLGKFLAGVGLVAIALLLTLPLPVTVSLLGPLDWGPVIGGYVAALALASAYVAIGLWVSSRTDNQIVSLILTAIIAGLFYLLGSDVLTALFGQTGGEWLRLLGSGSRFESITRGVLDLRDLYYYGSITAVFLVLNRLSLERIRWAGNTRRPAHRRWHAVTALLTANVLAANLWLGQVGWARTDLTEGRIYTLSEATRAYLDQVREPLLIRGYFSAQTHPLLAPLVPRLRDLLREYAVLGGERVRVEFLDPHDDPELEEEAGRRYGIRPVPFQTTSKYQASVVNSYFDVLVAYGDQHEVLNYRDLIELKLSGEADIDVELRNPEYDITGAIRKVLNAYQGGGNPFDSLTRKLVFQGFISADERLPAILVGARESLGAALAKLGARAGDRLSIEFADPDARDGALGRQLTEDFGFRPMVTGLLDPQPFWFYMTLSDGREQVQLPLPEDLSPEGFERALEAAIKRFSSGFLKTVAVVKPAYSPGFGGMQPSGKRFDQLREALSADLRWLETDLAGGQVPAEADLLVLLAPEELGPRALFAIDQFLMQGGTVLIATAPVNVDVHTSIDAAPRFSGLEEWLDGYGLRLSDQLLLDPQSAALAIPVERQVSGFTFQEIRLIDYPYIVDVRESGLNPDSSITAGLRQISVPWAVPIEVDAERNRDRQVTGLLHSSAESWTSASLDLVPDFDAYPRIGFEPGAERGRHLLAVAVQGRFDSWFKDKPSPLLEEPPPDESTPEPDPGPAGETDAPGEGSGRFSGVIERSPDSARIILIGSNSIFADAALDLASDALGTIYQKPIEFAQNAIDWSLEDRGLVSIRSRGHFARTLEPMGRSTQAFWEYGNYALAGIGLLLVWWAVRRRRAAVTRRYARLLKEV
jgi:ABC-2 type transport system permease protein